MKTFTEEDLRNAFKAGRERGIHEGRDNYFDAPFDEDEYISSLSKIIEEETIPVTLGLIKATCGWMRFCDVTGGNHYMLNEWSVEDSEIFKVKESHAKKLGFIK